MLKDTENYPFIGDVIDQLDIGRTAFYRYFPPDRIRELRDNRHNTDLCLSEIKSGHIRDTVRRGLGGKEYALPSLRSAIEAHPCPRPSACASH